MDRDPAGMGKIGLGGLGGHGVIVEVTRARATPRGLVGRGPGVDCHVQAVKSQAQHPA